MRSQQRFNFAGLVIYLVLLLSAALPAMTASAQQPAADYRSLAALLEDEHARNMLIEELRALDARGETAAPELLAEAPPEVIAAEAPSGQAPEEVSYARRMAVIASAFGDSLGQQLLAVQAVLDGLRGVEASSPALDTDAIAKAATHLAIVIVATFAVFLVLRKLVAPGFSGLDSWISRGSEKLAMLRTVVAVALAALIDLAAVGVAYLVGGFVGSVLVAQSAADATRLTLFLNAFLVVEIIKLGLRTLFSSRYAALRLVPLEAPQAQYCNRFAARIAGFVGYGVLVLVPVINFNISATLGSTISSLIVFLAVAYAAVVIVKNRLALRDRLLARAERSSGAGRLLLRLLARSWHVFALGYALLILVVSVMHPTTALPFVALATAKTALYIGAGLLLSVVITQLVGKEIVLSDNINARMPKLQARVNTYVPGSLKLIRVLIMVVVLVLSLDAWAVYDLAAWYATAAGAQTVSALIDILIILAVAAVVWVGLASLIEHRLTPKEETPPAAAARAETLLGLFHSTLAIAIIIMTVMIVLAEIGVNIGPLIAGAGVLGLAVGFGAQKLVQDVITGVFIQLENAMNTGDFVDVGGHAGTVDRVGVRSVGLRDLYGTYHIVPFSSVAAVSNFTREFGNHVGEYRIAYRESIDDAIAQLHAAFEELKEGDHKDNVLAPLDVAGVVTLADSSVNIRAVIKTAPGYQWAVGRAYNRLVKLHFDKAGIEIPFPHTTLYFGEDKDGRAPAGNIHLTRGSVVDTQDGKG